MQIKEIAEVIVGQIMPRVICKDEEPGEFVEVLMPKAISNGTIILENIKVESVKKKDTAKTTKIGDVVMKLSSPYDAIHITEECEGLLVPSFCAIIRFNDKKFPREYAVAYLNSKQVKEELTANAIGTTRAMTRPKDIEQIDIPKISEEGMKRIGKMCELSNRKIRILRSMIETETQLMEKALFGIASKEE